jgi:nucleoside-diphosphate-sugar epimerase
MRYAMTGATGFVGGALACRLRDAGHGVLALARDPARVGDLTAIGVEPVPGDLDDTAALDRLCQGVDGFFHVAGWYKLGHRDPSPARRVNVEGTRNALAAAKRNQVPRVVYTSTLAVNSDTEEQTVDETYRFTGEHLSDYDRSKAEAHDIAASFAAEGLPVVTVQPGLVYGPGDTAQTGAMIAQVVAGKRPPVPRGGGVCWGHVDDIARGHVLAMENGRPGESYMLAGPGRRLRWG